MPCQITPICNEMSVMIIEHALATNDTMHSLLQITPEFNWKDLPITVLADVKDDVNNYTEENINFRFI